MRRKVDSRTVWSLTAIRNGKQENADGIDNAQFYYGRWQSEVRSPFFIPHSSLAVPQPFLALHSSLFVPC